MLEQLIKMIGRLVWEDSLAVKMQYYKASFVVYSIFAALIIATGLLLLFGFYNWMLAIGYAVGGAAVLTATVSAAAAGLLLAFWQAYGIELKRNAADRILLEDIIASFLIGLQIEPKEKPDRPERDNDVSDIREVKKFKK